MIKKLKPDALGYWLTLLLLTVPFTYMLLSTVFHVRLNVMHTAIGVPAAILLVLLLGKPQRLREAAPQVKWLLAVISAFFLLTLVGQALNFQSPLYYLSGLRNNGRYFVFFFACIFFLKSEQRETYMKVIDGIFVVNFVVTLYQFFVLGIQWDYLGGIFGVEIGCSSDTNLLLLIVIAHSVIRYMHQREKAWECLFKCVAALIVAALAEIKIFFLEFAAIVVLAVLMTKFTRKKLFFMLGCGVGIVIGIQVLSLLFPGWAGWFNLSAMLETATSSGGYMGMGDLNRLTAAPVLWNDFLLTLPQKLFGLGLGNCDCGPVNAMTSAFYGEYYHLNYTLFSSGFILLETGLVGTLVYLSFFLLLFFAAHSLERSGRADPMYCQLTKILSPMCLVLFVYDCTLRTENGFFLYFAIALAFMGSRKAEAN